MTHAQYLDSLTHKEFVQLAKAIFACARIGFGRQAQQIGLKGRSAVQAGDAQGSQPSAVALKETATSIEKPTLNAEREP